ncbi:DNA polymerase III subunit delta [Christensenella tenuis]|uniref:DNA polymerase III subunit delta n=1 Tax=Christensenella tenuis TaxID=2763033 RepID=A0ABR7EBW8_9FIRM|nr:DNA polymerase III subunit delta [Christensenella tenuis]MBC5647268.1 DNA polymerase III subunit delta [Christensenella tenuis]
MKAREALKQIKGGDIKNFILVAGEDDAQIQQAFHALLAALNVQMPELNLSVFEERPEPMAVVRSLETLPFMGERRVVVIKNTDLLSPAASGEFSAPFEKANLPAQNVLCIVHQGKVDKRKAFVKYVMKKGMFIECNAMKENELAAYIVQAAKRRGLLISVKNAQTLAALADGDMGIVQNELEKLSCVCRGDITADDIEKYAVKSLQYNVYKIHDLMVGGYAKEAHALIGRLLAEDNNPIGFLTLLSNNFRQMLVARACRDARFPEQKIISHIMKATGTWEFAARRALTQCKQFTAPQIRRALEKLAQMDFDAKQGVISLKTDLYPLLVDIYMNPNKKG